MTTDLGSLVALAQAGDRVALERLVREVQPLVRRLALRFLGNPHDAEDATQEILVRVVTRLGGFKGDSRFTTWVYRVATNHLLTMQQGIRRQPMTFEDFAEDLLDGLSAEPYEGPSEPETSLALEEIRIGCTLAMLQCLDRNHRLAYILGEIMELDHKTGAEILGIEPAAFRKRLSRSRTDVTSLMQARCGLFDPDNLCRCSRRVQKAIELGRADPDDLLFANSYEQARRFPLILAEIRKIESARRAAHLYRAQCEPPSQDDFAGYVERLLSDLQ